ncbi:MAG TPA: two-component regulator propeller domain-containing protein [Vicinamibacterales bacterium]|nr:two-component regulator propeller domain-containing protein [Vicinamibacterales bacterium]
MRCPVLALALAIVAAPAHASARPTYALTAWTAEKGLPSGDVFAITEDRAGYLWIATGSGLVRFDGVQFDTRRAGLPGSSVAAIVAARDGSVWAGFNDAPGVVRVRDGQVSHYYGAQDGLGGCVVTSLLEDRHGTVWAGCRRGLASFDGTAWRLSEPDAGWPRDTGVSSLFEDRGGALWVAGSTGVFRRSEGDEAFTLVDRTVTYAQSLTDDADGQIWVSDSHRLAHRLGAVDRITLGPEVRLPSAGWRLLRDEHDAIWIAALGSGLLRLETRGSARRIDRVGYESVISGSPRTLFEDHEHNIWVGMRGGGLLRVSEVAVDTDVALAGVTNDGVRAMTRGPDGAIWVATGHSLNRFAGSARDVFSVPQTLALHFDRRGTLWVATAEAVGPFVDGRLRPWTLPETLRLERTAAITTDDGGRVWLCTLEQGVFISERETLVPATADGVAGRGCSFTMTDSHGRVWTGFQGGGATYFDGRFHRLDVKDGLSAGPVLSITEDTAGDIWIGTDSGVSRWKDGRLVTAHVSADLGRRLSSALIDDDNGQMWLGADGGAALVRFSRRDFAGVNGGGVAVPAYVVFDGSDGLEGPTHWASRPAIERDGTGRLWFATGNGVVVMNPRRPPVVHRPSAPRIELMVADGRELDRSGLVTLPNGSSVSIAYSAVTLSSGSKVRFRYLLQGYQTAWVNAGASRTATFDRLPGGRYRFRVAVATDNTWVENDAPFDFAVRARFFQTVWFYALLAAAALTVAGTYWWIRMRMLRRQFALVLGERARVGREIHDTLLQSLGAVGVELEVVASQLRASDAPLRDELTRVRREISRCIGEARESILRLRSPRLETRDLASALEELADDVATARAIQVDVETRGRAWAAAPETDEQLLRIAQEAIGNAVRHGRAKCVRLTLDYDRERVALRVADDGCGFVPSDERSDGGHWGLTTMRERAQRIGGQLKIMSGLGEGTVVEAVVPRPGGA